MTTRRRSRRGGSDLPGVLVTAGAAVGLWLASQHAEHSHQKAKPCPKHVQPRTCLSHALGSAVTPFIVGALTGALVGLLLAVVFHVVRRAIRAPRSASRTGRRRRRSTGFTQAPTGPAADAVDARSASAVEAAVPNLTKPELHAMRVKIRRGLLVAMREMNVGGDRDDILSRVRSIGGFTSRELEASSPPRYRKKHPLQIDHDLSWGLTDLKRDGLATNPARGIWMLTDAGQIQPESPLIDDVAVERLAELQAMPYDEYLLTPEWKQTRAAALVRADHRCALDPSHTGRLDVHHRFYERRGAELPSDLIVLCHPCHRLHHGHNGRPSA